MASFLTLLSHIGRISASLIEIILLLICHLKGAGGTVIGGGRHTLIDGLNLLLQWGYRRIGSIIYFLYLVEFEAEGILIILESGELTRRIRTD